MKKSILSIIALLALGGMATAQTISIPENLYVSAGQTMAIPVSVTIDDSKVDTYSALTLYAEFPATGFTTTGAYKVSSDWEGVSAAIPAIAGDGKATIPFSSAKTIVDTKINNIVIVNIKVDDYLAAGTYPVKIGSLLENAAGTVKDKPSDVDFTIHVTDADVTLDENSPLDPESTGSDVNIHVHRTMASGKCHTICLPFDMDIDQVKTAFGNDVKIYELPEEDVFETVGDQTTVAFIESDIAGDQFYANWPYIVIPSKDVTDFTVTSEIDFAPDVVKWEKKEGKKNVVYSSFTGTYHAGDVVPENYLFLNDNKFYFSKGKTIAKGFRAYFYFKDVVSSSAPFLKLIDSNSTGISSINNNQKSEGAYYNLNGQRVETPVKGLFIKNGKKLIVK